MILTANEIEKYFFCQGRRYAEGGRLFFNASGAGFKGCFEGRALRLTLFSSAVEKDRNAFVRLTVDGKTRRVKLPLGEKVLKAELPQGKHVFEVIKLTETANDTLGVFEAETDGEFLVYHEKKDLKIEFIGDSITTGFGVLCKEKYGEYKTKEQDVTKAFSYLTAKALNAEYQVIAAGGWPIYKSKYSCCAIPDFYDNVDLTRNTQKYDRSAFVPDLFVVALGTNDESYLADLSEQKRKEERAEVKRRFSAFVEKLLKNGKPVILVYGFLDCPDLKTLTEEVWEETASPLLSTLEVKCAVTLDDICAGHPGKRCHKLAAARLTKAVKTLL